MITPIKPPTTSEGTTVCGGSPVYAHHYSESVYAKGEAWNLDLIERSPVGSCTILVFPATVAAEHWIANPEVRYPSYGAGAGDVDLSLIDDQIAQLSLIENGWLDGDGISLPKAGLNWLREVLSYFSPTPTLYPTPDGGVQAEWSFEGREVSLEVDLDTHRAEWHDLNTITKQSILAKKDLSNPSDLDWIAGQLLR